MADAPSDHWQTVFFAAAALLVLVQAWRGWRLGVVRQVTSIAALAAGYLAAYVFGPGLAPLLRPIGMPDAVLSVVAGTVVALVTVAGINLVCAILFKKTSDQSVGLVRFGYGAAGACVGAVFGLVLVWVSLVGIRVLGTLAETSARPRPAGSGPASLDRPQPEAWVRGLAEMKHSLEQGAAGAVVQQVDPVPRTIYSTISKVGAMASSAQTVERFLTFPGVRPLAEHPKMIALLRDPQIARDILARNYFGLLRNPAVVQVANDAEMLALIRNLEFEKALDHALVAAPKVEGRKPKGSEPLPAGR